MSRPPSIQPCIDGRAVDAEMCAAGVIGHGRAKVSAPCRIHDHRMPDAIGIAFDPWAGQVIEEFVRDEQSIEGLERDASGIAADLLDPGIEMSRRLADVDADGPDASLVRGAVEGLHQSQGKGSVACANIHDGEWARPRGQGPVQERVDACCAGTRHGIGVEVV